MGSNLVVPMHQEAADIALSLLSRSVTRDRYPFRFQAAEHAIHSRVIPAIPPATHAVANAITLQSLTE